MPKVSDFTELTTMPSGMKIPLVGENLLPVKTLRAYAQLQVSGPLFTAPSLGGTFTAGVWTQRNLSAPITPLAFPSDWIAESGDGGFNILKPFRFRFHGFVYAYGVGSHVCRLVLDGGGSQRGIPAYSNPTEPSMTGAYIDVTWGGFVGTLRVEHFCEITRADDGLGYSNLSGLGAGQNNWGSFTIELLPDQET